MRIYVTEGGTMEKPPDCDPALYELMQQCWQTNRNDRPTFMQIIQKLLLQTAHDVHSRRFLANFQNKSFFASQANRLGSQQETGQEASTGIEMLDIDT